MLPGIRTVHRPDSTARASRLLAKGEGKAAVLAGGTSLILSGRRSLTDLVDLSGCGLEGISLRGRVLRIGAMARMAELASSPLPRDAGASSICEGAASVGSTLTRNLVTAGGNLCQLFPWCHLPVVLLSLDAELALAGAGRKTIPAGEFFSGPPRAVLGEGGILQEARIKAVRDRLTAFERFSRTSGDRALVTVAVSFRLRSGEMHETRAVAGGLAPRPQRIVEVEDFLDGKRPGPAAFSPLRTLVPARLKTAADARASRDFKLHVLGVLLERAFTEGLGRKPGG